MAKEKDPFAGYPDHFRAAWESGGSVLVHGAGGSVHAASPDELPEGWDQVKPVPVLETTVAPAAPAAPAKGEEKKS